MLGKQAAKHIPDAWLIELPGYGHAPQIEDPARFEALLLESLAL